MVLPINKPYAGGFITDIIKPNDNRHAVQIEINRDLYLKKNYTISSEAVKKLTDFIEKIIKSVFNLLDQKMFSMRRFFPFP